MTILETNSKNLNDKIQSLREITLALVKGLNTIHGVEEVNVIHKALELANLNAWKAQMINNAFEITPKIEQSLTRRATYSIIEVRDSEVKLNIYIIAEIIKIVTLTTEVFGCIADLDYQLCENYKEFSDAEFEIEEQKIESVSHVMTRTLDCLSDAALWSELFLERLQA